MVDDVKFYRYHPVTGQDAEDFSDVPEKDRNDPANIKELAAMKESGATFWWGNWPEGGDFHRVERINIQFVLRVSGIEAIWIDEKPIVN